MVGDLETVLTYPGYELESWMIGIFRSVTSGITNLAGAIAGSSYGWPRVSHLPWPPLADSEAAIFALIAAKGSTPAEEQQHNSSN